LLELSLVTEDFAELVVYGMLEDHTVARRPFSYESERVLDRGW
jgi:hypothetical protein